MKIYVASSWRNDFQPTVIARLRAAGHDVYDFKNPDDVDKGFHWSEIDLLWKDWSPLQFIEALEHPIAKAGFTKDFDAMQWAEACVLVMPCGRSAHLEAGWFVGAGKPLIILLDKGEPELMYDMADRLCVNIDGVIHAFSDPLFEAYSDIDPELLKMNEPAGDIKLDDPRR